MKIIKMKGLIMITTILIITNFNLSAQIDYSRYHTIVDSARLYHIQNDFAKSAELYEDAFKLNKPLLRDVTNAISTNLELKNWNAVTFYYNLLMVNFGYQSITIKNMIDFENSRYTNHLHEYQQSKSFLQLQSNFEINEKMFRIMFNRIDSTLREEIILMVEKDQFFRNGNSTLFTSNIEKVRKIDQENIQRLKKIINDNGGWPSFEILGLGADPFVIVLHLEDTDTENLNYFDKVLKDAVKMGKIEKYFYDHFRNYKQIH